MSNQPPKARIKSGLRSVYKQLVPYEQRQRLYKARHPEEYEHLRTAVYTSEKGDFSLRSYDQLNCLFVHITKTAGTSVALSLFGELPYHYTAIDYRVIYGKRDFNEYFKFGFVRNPWDRLYSAYRYLQGGGWNSDDAAWAEQNLSDIRDFEDFVVNWLTPEKLNSHVHFWPQSRFIADAKGRLLLDYCARFETIDQDYQKIAQHLNINTALKSTNASARKKDFRTEYTAEMREKVLSLYGQDISLLGYDFDGFVDHPELNRNRL